jgi:hypothetical protein
MIIALADGSTLTLSIKSCSAGGALTVTAPGGVPKPVSFGQQLRALLAPLGADAVSVHLDMLTQWCRIALGGSGGYGHKANKANRANWQRSLQVTEAALSAESEQPAAVREVA